MSFFRTSSGHSSDRVVIVGAGFSGALTAASILRARDGPTVALVDPTDAVGRGPAYGTQSPRRFLNVHVGGMSACPTRPGDFLDFVRIRRPEATSDDYVARGVYGDYVESVLAGAEAAAPGRLMRLHGEALDAARDARGGWRVSTTAGEVCGGALVVASGTPAHVSPEGWPTFAAQDARFIEDPRRREFGRSDPLDLILVFGTGLTMVDVALDVAAASSTARIVAVSRRGLLPLPHIAPAVLPLPVETFDGGALVGRTLRDVVRAVRATARRHGADWRRVVGSLRSVTNRVWEGWTEAERGRFTRHLLPYWNVHRHRVAPQAGAALDDLRNAGRLEVLAGRVATIDVDGGGRLRAEIVLRDGSARIAAPTLCINAAGPNFDVKIASSPFLRRLVERGAARSGPLGSGLDVADDGALIDAAGRPAPDAFVVGALRMGKLFETTAVPELRVQVASIAATLTARLRAPDRVTTG